MTSSVVPLSCFRNIQSRYLLTVNSEPPNDAFGLKVRAVKHLEMHSVLVACISYQSFIIAVVLTLARHFLLVQLNSVCCKHS